MAPKGKRGADAIAGRAPLKRAVEQDILPANRLLPDHIIQEGVCGACLLPVDQNEQVGLTDSCKHFFHYECIERWSQTENSCPQCKVRFFWLASYSSQGQRESLARIRRRDQEGQEDEAFEDLQICESCKEVGDEASLLLCDGMHGTCNAAFHCACVGLSAVPRESWFCKDCVERGFDIDAEGCRGKRMASSSSSSAAPSSDSVAAIAPTVIRQSPAAIAAAMQPALLTAAASTVAGRRHHAGSSSGTAGTVPPQLRLSSMACLTPAVEMPAFRTGGGGTTTGSAVAPDRGNREPVKEGIFASFAARRRARRDAASAQPLSSAPSFSLNPAYEEDFMGRTVR